MQVAVLTAVERNELKQREAQIEQSVQAVDTMLEALTIIRDKRLYRETHRDFESYCQDRWGKTWKRWRQLLQSQQVVGSLQEAYASGQIKHLPINESQTRALNTVPLDERPVVWKLAEQVAGDSVPTGAQVELAKLKHQVYATRFSPLIQRMDKGEVSPARALEVSMALQSCEPPVRYDMLKWKVTDRTVILEMNRLYQQGRESYGEIATSGYLQYADESAIPLEKATAADLRRLLDERMAEHRRRAAQERAVSHGLQPIIVTLYGNDPQRTFKALQRALSAGQLDALHQLFLAM